MIRIDINELERLTDIFVHISSLVEDAMERTKALRNEMELDEEFMAMPEFIAITEMLDSSINKQMQICDTVNNLKNAMIMTPDAFIDSEAALLNKIVEMTARLDAIGSQLDSCMSSNQVVVVDNSEELRSVNNVEQLVADSVTEMEVTNIAAISRRISRPEDNEET